MCSNDRPTIRYWLAVSTVVAVLMALSIHFIDDRPWLKATQLYCFVLLASVGCHAILAYTRFSYFTRLITGSAAAIVAWLLLTQTRTVSFPWSSHDSLALPELSSIAFSIAAFYLADRAIWNSITRPAKTNIA